jgi:hypothetical protein
MFHRYLLFGAAWLTCSAPLWAQNSRAGDYSSYYDNPQADVSSQLTPQASPLRQTPSGQQSSARSKPLSARPAPIRDSINQPPIESDATSQPSVRRNNANQKPARRTDADQQPIRRYEQNRRVQQASAVDSPAPSRMTPAVKKSLQTDAPPPPPADMQPFPPPANNTVMDQPPPPGAGSLSNQPYDAPWNGAAPMGGCGSPGCTDGCSSCGDCGCDDCGGSCRPMIYARAEYLSWWLRGDSPPPLVTTSTAGTAQSVAGQLGQPNTTILFGGSPINNNQRSGARITLGMYLTPMTRLEGEWFGLGAVTTTFNSSSDGSTILARPFFNMNPAVSAQDARLLGYPGVFAGSVHVSETSRFLGAGINATYNVLSTACGARQHNVDFIYGFRYLRLSEGLSINDQSNTLSTTGLLPAGTIFNTSDAFKTTNNFYGLNLGVMSEQRMNRWSLTSIGRLGIGSTAQSVNINGNTTVTTAAGGAATSAGGLLTQPTNIGSYHHDAFTLAPQLELKLSYYFRPNLRAMVGYDLLYWSNVVRPGAQVNTNVNTTQATGGTLNGVGAPNFTLHETDLWAQGVSVGGEWTF